MNAINKIDWELLSSQKLSLLHVIEMYENRGEKQIAQDLTGILHMIDALEDEHEGIDATQPEAGAASVLLDLTNGTLSAYHGTDKALLHSRPIFAGEWKHLWKFIRKS